MQNKAKPTSTNPQASSTSSSDGVVVVEVSKRKGMKSVKRFKQKPTLLLFIVLIAFAIFAGVGYYFYSQKNDNIEPARNTITETEINRAIQASLNDQQRYMPAESDSFEHKQSFYEEYLQKLIALGDAKKIIEVYTTKVAPLDMYFYRDLQDQIASILLRNGEQQYARNIYIDSLAQAQKELADATPEDKTYIENEISIYKSRIENL